MIQGFLAAYLSVAAYFVFRSEAELGKGHADIALEPLVARYPHLRRGYLIELKYLKRSEPADQAAVAAAARLARTQLVRYLAGPASGAAVSGGALHRSDRGLPRLGAGVLRRRARMSTQRSRERAAGSAEKVSLVCSVSTPPGAW